MASIEVWEYPPSRNACLAATTITVRFCSIRAAFGLSSDHCFMLYLRNCCLELDQLMNVASVKIHASKRSCFHSFTVSMNRQRKLSHLRKRALSYTGEKTQNE